MVQEIRDTINFVNSADLETIVLNNENGNVSLRGNLIVFNGDAHALRFDPADNLLTVGTQEHAGYLFLKDDEGRVTFYFDGKAAILAIGAEGKDGNLRVKDNEGRVAFDIDGANAFVKVGAEGNEGDIQVLDGAGNAVFHADGENGIITIGSTGNEGDLRILDSSGRTTLDFDAGSATLKIGVAGNEGDIQVLDDAGRLAITANANTATLTLGTTDNDGDLIVRDSSDTDRITLNGELGQISARDAAGTQRVLIDGNTGDIKIFGADCAEKFEVAELADPGVVMIINEQGKLRPSAHAYDRRVAGVVAGGGDLRPGIVLGHTGSDEGLLPIALTGRTYCKVDAGFGAVAVGDLLTTSPTPGYAMKASDPHQAFGAVIGKAMRPLTDGQGMIPILVALQ